MAVTDQHSAIQFGWVDPQEDPAVQRLELRTSIETPIDPRKIEMIYDRPSDTFYFLLFGRERPSVVVGGRDPISFLADPETGEFVGFHVEDFFAYAATEMPRLLEAVEIADLRGISRGQVRKERHKILGYRGRLRAWVHRMTWRIQIRTRSRRQAVVRGLIRDEALGFPAGSAALST